MRRKKLGNWNKSRGSLYENVLDFRPTFEKPKMGQESD